MKERRQITTSDGRTMDSEEIRREVDDSAMRNIPLIIDYLPMIDPDRWRKKRNERDGKK